MNANVLIFVDSGHVILSHGSSLRTWKKLISTFIRISVLKFQSLSNDINVVKRKNKVLHKFLYAFDGTFDISIRACMCASFYISSPKRVYVHIRLNFTIEERECNKHGRVSVEDKIKANINYRNLSVLHLWLWSNVIRTKPFSPGNLYSNTSSPGRVTITLPTYSFIYKI